MIVLDEALNIAKDFIQNVSKTDGDWQLEEATFDDKKEVWSITYSFWRENEQKLSPMFRVGQVSFNGRRVYRTVKINAKTNKVIEMKAGFAERQAEVA